MFPSEYQPHYAVCSAWHCQNEVLCDVPHTSISSPMRDPNRGRKWMSYIPSTSYCTDCVAQTTLGTPRHASVQLTGISISDEFKKFFYMYINIYYLLLSTLACNKNIYESTLAIYYRSNPNITLHKTNSCSFTV